MTIYLAVYFGSRLLFRKDLTGMLLIGLIPGATLEWITEAYWDYHLQVYLWKDVSFYVFLGWAYNFTFLVLLSDLIYRRIPWSGTRALPDPARLAVDGVVGTVFFVANEFIGMRLLGLWDYAACAGWTLRVPGLDYPLEGILGASLISLAFPTLIRHWGDCMRFYSARHD